MKTLRLAVILVLLLCFSTLGFAQGNCVEVQQKVDAIFPYLHSWANVHKTLGNPTRTASENGQVTSLIYTFNGCQATFYLNGDGKISSKHFQLGTFPTESSRSPRSEIAAPNDNQAEIAETLKGLQTTLQQLRSDITRLERILQNAKLSAGPAPRPATKTPITVNHLATRSPFKTAIPTSSSTPANTPTILNSTPATSTTVNPAATENGSYYGQISEATGRPKTVHVQGYYRKDGTYVRGHYRSAPSKK